MAASSEQLGTCLTCHSWNRDRTKVAVCPNNNHIQIYAVSGNSYTLEATLKEHDQTVTSIDWAPNTNRIVSCSQDRNAYVWTFANGKWNPVLVILRVNRAATHVKWSPNETKFAVATGSKLVSVCYFEEENDWWVSKHIKKNLRSTVTAIDWHPDNILLAVSSTDFKARVFSGFIRGVDSKPADSLFGARLPFGDCLMETPVLGWVHMMKFSPSGNRIAWVGHDSSICFTDVVNGQINPQVILGKGLPMLDLLWLDENRVAGVGHDATPLVFANQGGSWKFEKKLESSAPKAAKAKSNAFTMFQNKVDVGQETREATLDTVHQNAINDIEAYGPGKFSTSAFDGKIVVWNF